MSTSSTNPSPTMSAMTTIPNPLAWSDDQTGGREILLYYLTNNGQQFVQKRDPDGNDPDPHYTPEQPTGPLASPCQFASLRYDNLVEVYGMVQGTVQGKGESSTATTVFQPYVISPIYRPLVDQTTEDAGTDLWALAACGDGKENGWIYYVKTDKNGETQVHEIPLSWSTSTVTVKKKQNPNSNSMLSAVYLGAAGGNLNRWIFYVAPDPDGSDDGDSSSNLIWFFDANDSSVGGTIPNSDNVAATSPLASCIIPTKDGSDKTIICYYVNNDNTLVRMTHLVSASDPGDWEATKNMGSPPKFELGPSQMSCVVDSATKTIRLYYNKHNDTTKGWSVFVDKFYH